MGKKNATLQSSKIDYTTKLRGWYEWRRRIISATAIIDWQFESHELPNGDLGDDGKVVFSEASDVDELCDAVKNELLSGIREYYCADVSVAGASGMTVGDFTHAVRSVRVDNVSLLDAKEGSSHFTFRVELYGKNIDIIDSAASFAYYGSDADSLLSSGELSEA